MPQRREVSESVRARLHQLNTELAPGVAEDVALAMLRGAAEGFREITRAEDPEATRRLLAAVELDAAAAFAALVH